MQPQHGAIIRILLSLWLCVLRNCSQVQVFAPSTAGYFDIDLSLPRLRSGRQRDYMVGEEGAQPADPEARFYVIEHQLTALTNQVQLLIGVLQQQPPPAPGNLQQHTLPQPAQANQNATAARRRRPDAGKVERRRGPHSA